jgi:hypothetical protein
MKQVRDMQDKIDLVYENITCPYIQDINLLIPQPTFRVASFFLDSPIYISGCYVLYRHYLETDFLSVIKSKIEEEDLFTSESFVFYKREIIFKFKYRKDNLAIYSES